MPSHKRDAPGTLPIAMHDGAPQAARLAKADSDVDSDVDSGDTRLSDFMK